MKAYFVVSFLLFGIMATTLAVANWTILDWPWRLVALGFVPTAVVAFGMALVAVFTTYRRE